MKCVKNKVTNEIERVSNEIAYNRVNNGEWVFCAKHEYKEYKLHKELVMSIKKAYDNR